MENRIFTGSLRDDEFIRGDIPMTKEDIRTLVISRLRLAPDMSLLDIGAGTGSVSVQSALSLPRGRVYAVERREEGCGLIRQNCSKFNLSNVDVIQGEAPLRDFKTPVDRIFLGGSGSRLDDILAWCDSLLVPKGLLVATAITLETMNQVSAHLDSSGYTGSDMIQVQVNRFDKVGGKRMSRAQNPIFILFGERT